MAEATHSFPPSFLWGTATAGYQVEGNSLNTDWWEWEQGVGRIAQGHKSARACDWWEGRRWREDFDRAAGDGHAAPRMSGEGGRGEPAPAAAHPPLHALQPEARGALAIPVRPIEPAHPGFRPDAWAARTQFNLFSGLFPAPTQPGRLRQGVWPPAPAPPS